MLLMLKRSGLNRKDLIKREERRKKDWLRKLLIKQQNKQLSRNLLLKFLATRAQTFPECKLMIRL